MVYNIHANFNRCCFSSHVNYSYHDVTFFTPVSTHAHGKARQPAPVERFCIAVTALHVDLDAHSREENNTLTTGALQKSGPVSSSTTGLNSVSTKSRCVRTENFHTKSDCWTMGLVPLPIPWNAGPAGAYEGGKPVGLLGPARCTDGASLRATRRREGRASPPVPLAVVVW